jgi:2-polyprenyl-3-methyl-5-hydroxy-6-metoxy-1,4-benzoquinol methylase
LQPDWSSGSHLERFRAVRRHLENRRVLDIGAGSGVSREDWMHAQIAAVASEIVGVELDEELVEQARDRGFDLVSADAQQLDLGRRFDVVFAGEVIEHLSCAAAFLDSAHRHLVPGGRLVLTTPNAFAVSNFVYRLAGRPHVNDDHMCWFDETTLAQLVRRHGFEIVEVSYIGHVTPGRLRRLVARAVRGVLPRHLAQNTLMVVAAPSG